MKEKNILFKSISTLVVILVLMTSCTKEDDPAELLVGNWTKLMQGRTVTVTFTADNKWQVEFIGDAGIDVWGSYIISNNQITIIDEGGEYMSSSSGLYSFSVTESSLTMSAISDSEDGRKEVVEGIWTKA